MAARVYVGGVSVRWDVGGLAREAKKKGAALSKSVRGAGAHFTGGNRAIHCATRPIEWLDLGSNRKRSRRDSNPRPIALSSSRLELRRIRPKTQIGDDC